MKSSHANFVFNYELFAYYGNFRIYPLIKSDITNITIVFENNDEVTFDYLILKQINNTNNNNRRLLQSIELEDNNNLNTINSFEKQQYDNENTIRKLEETIWDYSFKEIIKLKIDKNNQVNVIYIKSLIIYETINNETILDKSADNFLLLLTEEINKNNYPIIIEDNNNGYYNHYINILVNVINSELSLNF